MTVIVINHRVEIPEAEIRFSASRSSGAGGQHVNKTNTRISLSWSPETSSALTEAQKRRVIKWFGPRLDKQGVLHLHAEGARSQKANKDDVKTRFADLLRLALRIPKGRRETKPSRGAKERRLKQKKQQSSKKSSRRKPISGYD